MSSLLSLCPRSVHHKEASCHSSLWEAGAEGTREPEGPPQMEEQDLQTLVSLMRISQPIAKQLLQRLFLNLCAHPITRVASLRMLLSLLRAPLVGDDSWEPAASPMAVEAGALQRCTHDALHSRCGESSTCCGA